MEGVDYSWARPDPFCLASNGKRFAMRYFGAGTHDKHAHAAECNALAAADLSIVALVEGWEEAALEGYATGVQHAQAAAVELDQVGAPGDVPLYFAIDWDWQEWQWEPVALYFQGCADVVGRARVGMDGGIRPIERAAQYDVARWFFQTFAWSHGQWSPHNHVEQYRNNVMVCGGEVDLCRSVQKRFGAWRPGESSPPDESPPPPPSMDETPFEFTAQVSYLGDRFSDVASAVGAANQIVNGL